LNCVTKKKEKGKEKVIAQFIVHDELHGESLQV
jgi:hypothetical protein